MHLLDPSKGEDIYRITKDQLTTKVKIQNKKSKENMTLQNRQNYQDWIGFVRNTSRLFLVKKWTRREE